MRQYKITIPEPCNEKWQEMTPTEKGAHCDKCQKEVIDFSTYSQTELSRLIARGDSVCGRFRKDQLNRALPTLSRNSWRQKVAALGFSALLSASCSKESIVPEAPVEVQAINFSVSALQITIGNPDNRTPPILISGRITDGKIPLAGASVSLKGTRQMTQTDFEGVFNLETPLLEDLSTAELEIMYLGYQSYTHKLKDEEKVLDIVLEENETILGEVILEPIK